VPAADTRVMSSVSRFNCDSRATKPCLSVILLAAGRSADPYARQKIVATQSDG
jgi:hypothetical protein